VISLATCSLYLDIMSSMTFCCSSKASLSSLFSCETTNGNDKPSGFIVNFSYIIASSYNSKGNWPIIEGQKASVLSVMSIGSYRVSYLTHFCYNPTILIFGYSFVNEYIFFLLFCKI